MTKKMKRFLGATAVATACMVAACLLLVVVSAGKPAEATTFPEKHAEPQEGAHNALGGGGVWAWGDNYFGQLGDGAPPFGATTPVHVSGLSGVKDVAAGGFHNLALKRDGSVWAWGDYSSFDDDPISKLTPAKVSGLSGVKVVAAGDAHSLALAR